MSLSQPPRITSLADLPPLSFCRDRPDEALGARFAEATGDLDVHNIFNPSFYCGDAVNVYALRAIPRGESGLESFVCVEEGGRRTWTRISPERYDHVDAPRLIDPKVFTVGDAIYLTFNSGWVGSGNAIYVMQVHPTMGAPKRVELARRSHQERNWGFFGEPGAIYAIYRISPLVILELVEETPWSWRMERREVRPDGDVPTDLSVGTQPSRADGRYYFMAHRKYLLGRRKVYLGRLCALEPAEARVRLDDRWFAHSPDALRGSAVKHNPRLHSCTYFSGLDVSDSGVRLGYGINDVSFGFSRCHFGGLDS